jgi:hypothetical protein
VVNPHTEIIERLTEIQEDMTILLDQAEELLRPFDEITARAEANWIAQIKAALGLEGQLACNLGNTITDIEQLDL